ncbi:GNAT family N-acetyltransferase [Flavobacterium sp. N1994]|uniref:GNAT family N-acetyltransferase n=1 Tax=Flavobacterium sp. N1994 TaxID=2986827 RepID=UPI002221A91B|nr:GNAT family N-acetyltransferase [Flavobacterium sp. N1994]
MIELKKYDSSQKTIWDTFITNSRVNTFLFHRDFMEYHSDRFEDFSLLIYRKGKLEAVLPGNIKNNIFYTHQGLTYGGLVTSAKITAIDVLHIFEEVNLFLKENAINEVVYKAIPLIYHKQPMQEDVYALYRLKADKISCTLSSSIFTKNKIPFTESRKSGLRKAKNTGISIEESTDYTSFWNILDTNLTNNHGVKPVHTLEEIVKLRNLFPENIKLFCSYLDGKMIAGTVLFIMENIIHVQYISANDEGKLSGAIDLLFDEIINVIFNDIEVIDFGHSNEDSGNYLNERLIFQKEGFGGRGVVYEIYSYKI